jgi:hypothetical protein
MCVKKRGVMSVIYMYDAGETRERNEDGRNGIGWVASKEAHPFHSLFLAPRHLLLLLAPSQTRASTMEDNVSCLTVATTPFDGQKPGTSGLRKKVRASAGGDERKERGASP